MSMSSVEMLAMIRTCSLNRLVQYATFVSEHIRIARTSPSVKEALQGLRQILYTGVALDAQDSQWAFANGLRITVRWLFSAAWGHILILPVSVHVWNIGDRYAGHSAEERGILTPISLAAPLLVSRVGPSSSARLLRPCRGASPIFVPYISSEPEAADTGRPPMYEVVVAVDAPDAPPRALFSADGYWHTGDLFDRVLPSDGEPEGWVHRGRMGDWIKTSAGFVDTKCVLLPSSIALRAYFSTVDPSRTLYAENARPSSSMPSLLGPRELIR